MQTTQYCCLELFKSCKHLSLPSWKLLRKEYGLSLNINETKFMLVTKSKKTGVYIDHQKAKINLPGTHYEERKISATETRNSRKDSGKKIIVMINILDTFFHVFFSNFIDSLKHQTKHQ